MAKRHLPTLGVSEPTILVPLACERCLSCPACGGTHQVTIPLHTLPYPILSLKAVGTVNGRHEYWINGHEANEAAYNLAIKRMWA